MRAVTVTFSNGDTISTNINGTNESITEYYAIGKFFNLGHVNPAIEDNMQSVTHLEFLN